MLGGILRYSEEGDEERILARARTLTALARLEDPHRKRSLLQFLYEAALITKANRAPRRAVVRRTETGLAIVQPEVGDTVDVEVFIGMRKVERPQPVDHRALDPKLGEALERGADLRVIAVHRAEQAFNFRLAEQVAHRIGDWRLEIRDWRQEGGSASHCPASALATSADPGAIILGHLFAREASLAARRRCI